MTDVAQSLLHAITGQRWHRVPLRHRVHGVSVACLRALARDGHSVAEIHALYPQIPLDEIEAVVRSRP